MSADERVRATVARMAKQDPDTLADGTRLYADLGLNSAAVLELLMTLELELEVDLDPSALEPRHLETVGSLAEYLSGRQAG
jgi:acyl carrier protein